VRVDNNHNGNEMNCSFNFKDLLNFCFADVNAIYESKEQKIVFIHREDVWWAAKNEKIFLLKNKIMLMHFALLSFFSILFDRYASIKSIEGK
jgi:hypothetical protein